MTYLRTYKITYGNFKQYMIVDEIDQRNVDIVNENPREVELSDLAVN
jgi:hypothetical protein